LQNLGRISGEWSGFISWLSRPMVRIRVLELDWNRPISVGQVDFLENFAKRIGFENRKVAALLPLLGSPAQELNCFRVIAGTDCVFNIRVGPSLVKFVVERGDDILPGGIEDWYPIHCPIGKLFGEDANGVIDGLLSVT
jgi:hypothetical protein